MSADVPPGADAAGTVTELLLRWSEGHKDALDHLIPLVEAELRRLARRFLRDERDSHTLQPTALVNEVYLRLVDRHSVGWQTRAHFFGFAATTMRRILVDHARARATEKRGSGARAVSLDDGAGIEANQRPVDVLALDDALVELAHLDPRSARVVELRYFAGLTLDETAEVLGTSAATVSRDWTSARAFLRRALGRS